MGSTESTDEITKKAKALYDKENFVESLPLIKKLVERDEKSFFYHLWLGECYTELDKFENALIELNKAKQLYKTPIEGGKVFNTLGVCYSAMRNEEEALKNYNKAIECNKLILNYYSNRGETLYHLKKYTEAIEDFTKAINMQGFSRDYFWRGKCYYEIDRYSQSIVDFNVSINRKNSKYVLSSYFWKGKSEYYLGQLKNSLTNLTYAINRMENVPFGAYDYRGDVYFALGKYDLARNDFDKAILVNPDNDNTYNSRGLCFKVTGKYFSAIKDYTTAMKINSTYSEYFKNRGDCYLEIGNHNLALKDLNKAISKCTNDPLLYEYYTSRSEVFLMMRNFKLALQDMDSCAKIEVRYLLSFKYGVLHEYLNNPLEALKAYKKSIEIQNNNNHSGFFLCSFFLGVLLLKLCKYEDALEIFQKMMKMNVCYKFGYLKKFMCSILAKKVEDFHFHCNILSNSKSSKSLFEFYRINHSLIEKMIVLNLKPNNWVNEYEIQCNKLVMMRTFQNKIKITDSYNDIIVEENEEEISDDSDEDEMEISVNWNEFKSMKRKREQGVDDNENIDDESQRKKRKLNP